MAFMDAHTLALLEFAKVTELVAGYAATTLGKELARDLAPGTDLPRIREQIAVVTEMTEALSTGLTPPLGGLSDVRMLLRRAAIGSTLTGVELVAIKGLLKCTGQVFRYRARLSERWQILQGLLSSVDDYGQLGGTLEGCLDERGKLLDSASSELAVIRIQLRRLEERVQALIKRMLRDPDIRKALRYPSATVSGEHFVLPVAVNFRHKVEGIVHRTSGTGDTVYIEPADLARLSAERALLRAQEEKEEARILRRLTEQVGKAARPLQASLAVLAELDLIQAKARYALDYGHFAPELHESGRLWLRRSRHPLLEHLFRHESTPSPLGLNLGAASETGATARAPRQVVPIDVRLGSEFDLVIVTGPNTGGKTVAVKTVGLLCLMAQAGLHIPAAEGSQAPVFDQILADIGDEQSLEQSLSTFSSHIGRIAVILKTATARSLVLLDELGAGTDPTEGAALGRAILDELRAIGCRGMVTTHLGALKTYALHDERAENAAVEFDAQTLQPTYRLIIGQFGMSNALQIAGRLDLPKGLLRRARRYLHRRERRSAELKELEAARQRAELARQQALEAERQAQQLGRELEHRKEVIAKAEAKAEELRRARLALAPGAPVRHERLGVGRVVRIDLTKERVRIRVGIGEWDLPLAEVYPLS
jgi:DNA mismatch repair protein MutS2